MRFAFDQLNPIVHAAQILQASGAEIVKHDDAIAARNQRVDQVRSDKPGAAGDENFGHRS